MAIRAGLLSDFIELWFFWKLPAQRARIDSPRVSLYRARCFRSAADVRRVGRGPKTPLEILESPTAPYVMSDGFLRERLNVGDSRDSRRTNLIRCCACMRDDSSNTANSTISPARSRNSSQWERIAGDLEESDPQVDSRTRRKERSQPAGWSLARRH